jgi:Rieske 2Fe-2S family protein
MHDEVNAEPAIALRELIARQQSGRALDAEFYRSSEIYEHDIERVFMRSWLYVGHTSEIPEPGDYLLLEVAQESAIIVRDEEGRVRALVNVCRHRGSRVCVAPRGRVKTLVCRYHGWTYGLDGSLRSRRQMPEGFDPTRWGLKAIPVEVFHGLIFVNFSVEPVDFRGAAGALDHCLRPFHLERCKVAARRNYPVDANWKLALENFMECYHCAPAHPEYARIHSLKAPAAESEALRQEMLARSRRCGMQTDDVVVAVTDLAELHAFHRRHALYPGYLTGTEDGKAAAPLLGEVTGYDGGAADVTIGALNQMLIYPDHAVVYRFAARAPQRCDMEIAWLVRSDAEEGRDYDLARLTWLWDVTSIADKRIIDLNQQGVNSRFYEPGPYSEMERWAHQLSRWYLGSLAAREKPAASS